MATSQTGNKDVQGELPGIKRKLAWRMGFAGLMIVALLGGLAVFDRLSVQSDTESDAPQFTEPVPVAKKRLAQPLTPAEPIPEISKDEKLVGAPESSAPPIDTSAQVVEPPPRPEVAAAPVLRRAAPPAARPAAAPSQPVPAPAKPAESRAASPRSFSGYALRVGPFKNRAEAEAAREQMKALGIDAVMVMPKGVKR